MRCGRFGGALTESDQPPSGEVAELATERVPRTEQARLSGAFALAAGIVSLANETLFGDYPARVTSRTGETETVRPLIDLGFAELGRAALVSFFSLLLIVLSGWLLYIRSELFDGALVSRVRDLDLNEATRDEVIREFREQPKYQPEAQNKESVLDSSSQRFYLTIAAIVFSIAVVTILTGGMVKSPMATVLVSAFVLGQIFAPAGTTIRRLLRVGIVSGVLVETCYRVLVERDAGFAAWSYPDRAFLIPMILAVVASTFVNIRTVENLIILERLMLRFARRQPPPTG